MSARTRNTLSALERWYSTQCDDDWEHQFGVKIETLDNPGWEVTIDLFGTTVQDREFHAIDLHRTETDWICCRVEANQFRGFGGPLNLEEILRTFLDWSELSPGDDS